MILQANAIQIPLKDKSVQLCAFSPPYWGLRKYSIKPLVWPDGWIGDLGLEKTPELYLGHMMQVMGEVWRVLRDDGCCMVNLGDSYSSSPPGNKTKGVSGASTLHGVDSDKYRTTLDQSVAKKQDTSKAGIKPKSLCLIPQKFAIACQEQGWIIRSEIIWAKPNPMPESVKDRPTRSHEQVWMMVKNGKYYWDQDAVREKALYGDHPRNVNCTYTTPGQPTHTGLRQKGLKVKIPGGWDVGPGPHGTIHRTGRTEKQYQEAIIKDGRNIRSVWNIATSPTPEAHFATWPEKLARRMIQAASSAMCCPKCGAPWERVVEKGELVDVWHRNKTPHQSGKDYQQSQTMASGLTKSGYIPGHQYEYKTIDWKPSCKCEDNDGSGKSIVLDPFCGTGKTVVEAERLNRIGIGMDLSWEYLSEIASKRLAVPLQRQLVNLS